MAGAGEILHILKSSTLKKPLNEIDGNDTFFFMLFVSCCKSIEIPLVISTF